MKKSGELSLREKCHCYAKVPRLIHVCVPSTQSPQNKFQLLDMRNTHCVLVLEKSVKSLAQKRKVQSEAGRSVAPKGCEQQPCGPES